MTSEEHDHVQQLEGLVKRYRRRIVELKTEEANTLRQFAGWLTAEVGPLHDYEVPRLSEAVDRFLDQRKSVDAVDPVGDDAGRTSTRV